MQPVSLWRCLSVSAHCAGLCSGTPSPVVVKRDFCRVCVCICVCVSGGGGSGGGGGDDNKPKKNKSVS